MITYNIGIDMGTSSLKLILIDNQGNIVKQVSKEYSVNQPVPGWKEIEPEVWYQGMEQGIKMLVKDIDSTSVKGIGITGQMHTVIFLDEQGESIRPAIMWNDVRTKNLISDLKKKIAETKDVQYIAKIISTGSPAANLLWLKENELSNFKKMRRFLIGPDYLVYRLTGAASTDYCEASTSSLYDFEKDEWSVTMKNMIGIPSEVYPVIKGSGEIAGQVKEELCRKFGFAKTIDVIVGTGDNPAAAVSMGCLTKKHPVLSLGTSGVFMIPRTHADFDRKGKNIKFSIDGEQIVTLVQGVVQSVGSSVDWWMKNILKVSDIEAEMARLQEKDLQENELIFYPHLVGEKTIYGDPSIRGAFLGLGTDTTRAQMIIAVMEGIAFGFRQVIEEMNVSKESLEGLKTTGGGSKNQIWMQMIADILQTKLEQLDGNTGAGLGMALLAGQSNGSISDLERVSERLLSVKKIFLPNSNKKEYYDSKYKKYKAVYQALKLVD